MPQAFPDKRAVVCEGKARTWREFDRRINKIARTLAGMGIGKGDKIAILAANSIEYLETFMGGLRAGACVVPLSTMAAADALEKMLDDCDAKVLFLSDQYRGLVEPYDGAAGQADPGRPHRLRFRARRAGTTSRRWLAPSERRCRSSCRSSSSTTSTSSIQLGHDRPAQGHPAHPRHARPAGGALHGLRLRPGHDLARLDAALFQHDAGRGAGDRSASAARRS